MRSDTYSTENSEEPEASGLGRLPFSQPHGTKAVLAEEILYRAI